MLIARRAQNVTSGAIDSFGPEDGAPGARLRSLFFLPVLFPFAGITFEGADRLFLVVRCGVLFFADDDVLLFVFFFAVAKPYLLRF